MGSCDKKSIRETFMKEVNLSVDLGDGFTSCSELFVSGGRITDEEPLTLIRSYIRFYALDYLHVSSFEGYDGGLRS